MPADSRTKTTIIKLRKHKRTKETTCLVTAYDYPQSRIADGSGVDCILVGDSLGMTTLGHKTTIPVTNGGNKCLIGFKTLPIKNWKIPPINAAVKRAKGILRLMLIA